MEFFGDNGDDLPSTYSAPMSLFPEAAESQAAVRHRFGGQGQKEIPEAAESQAAVHHRFGGQGHKEIDLNTQVASSFPNMIAYQEFLMSAPATTTPSRSSRKRKRPTSSDPGSLPPRPYRAPPTAVAATRGGRAPSRGTAGRSGTSSRVPATSGGSGGGAATYRATAAAGGRGGSGGPAHFASGAGGSGGSGGPSLFTSDIGGGSGGGTSHFTAGIGGTGGSSSPSHFVIGTGGFSSADGTANEEEDNHPFGNESLTGEGYDKANWASNNTAAFCDMCVEEIRAGNRSNGNMTPRGYINIAEKYYLHVGLRHSKRQLKNRWDQLKALYNFWLWLNKQTGLGRANGTVVAPDSFWKQYTKNHSEWKKLKRGPPECLDQLEQMFEHTAVDGSTSCIPGESNDGDEGDDDDEGDRASPMSSNSRRASTTTSTCATSPVKKGKSPMLKVMKGMWGTMQSNSAEARAASITKAMALTVECGAEEGSAEHYMATKLFVKAENRDIFCTFRTNEGRLGWLKRNCQDYNVH